MNSGVDVLHFPEDLGRADDQWIQRIDNPADVVGKPSRRIGGVRALFKRNDFPVRFLPSDLGRGAHAGGIATNDNQSFPGHKYLRWFNDSILKGVWVSIPDISIYNHITRSRAKSKIIEAINDDLVRSCQNDGFDCKGVWRTPGSGKRDSPLQSQARFNDEGAARSCFEQNKRLFTKPSTIILT
jgi:hypothetical protein